MILILTLVNCKNPGFFKCILFYFILFYFILFTTNLKYILQSCGGGGGVSPQPPPVYSIHLDDATAATAQRRQCADHTPATGGEEREIETIQ